ncbi:metalloendopeptidase OMA1, mitochondrial-like [Tigriopus californicus]|uniref:metalloendopeptidase OMA1, mitochondrial-like n=1 Tax=Tigriopus californicus TaxID=6832 RepID=UPI0027DA53C7|nr:metalloendopeptidase OMA1, mitochondrial-like [Tigriopus californicus]
MFAAQIWRACRFGGSFKPSSNATSSLHPLLRPKGRPNRLMAPKPAQVHTSQAKSALPPILVGLVKPIARITAALFGRRVRIWWRKLPDQRRIAVLDKLKKSRMILGGLGAGTTIVLLYQYEAHIETCAITGRKRFLALRPEQIEKIARSEFEQLLETYERHLLPGRHPAYARVSGVANRILKANKDYQEIYGKDWTVTVIQDKERNAFVLPSGNIFVFTGMLDMCETDGQLGFVLSHEIAHTLLNHAVLYCTCSENRNQYQKAKKISTVNFVYMWVLVPLALLWAVLPNDGNCPHSGLVLQQSFLDKLLLFHGTRWNNIIIMCPLSFQSGNIFVFTGMLDMCETDGQLGFVLSHEIAHTLLNHAGEKISHVNFVYMWVLVPLALLWAVLPNDGIALIADWFFNKVIEIVFELPFSREMEREADEVGLTMAAKACFDVRQASLFWGKMEALESLEGHEKMPEILATHPTHDRRREYLETLVPEALKRREQSGCAQLKDTNVAFQDYWRRFRSLRPAA